MRHRHIQAFANALTADYFVDNDHLDSPRASTYSFSNLSVPATPGQRPVSGSTRIRKVSALSDFAPVNLRVRKRKKGTGTGSRHHVEKKQQEWLFVLVRWPLLVRVCTFDLFSGDHSVYNAHCRRSYFSSSSSSLASTSLFDNA